MQKRLLGCAAAMIAALVIGCQMNDGGGEQTPQSKILLSARVAGKAVPIEQFTEGGIPYTAAQLPYGVLLSASFEDTKLTLSRETVSAKIVEPEKDTALTVKFDAASWNTFVLEYTAKVEKPMPVKIHFSTEKGEAAGELKFKLLPEPEIAAVTHKQLEYTLGQEYSGFKLKPEFTCEPKEIAGSDGSVFLREESRVCTFTSSNEEIATVAEDGTVTTLKKEGSCDITITAQNGKTCAVKITVKAIAVPKTLTVSPNAINLRAGETKEITVVADPVNADRTLTDWQVENPDAGKIEAVDAANGIYKITALADGGAVFTAASQYNESIKVTVNLTVSKELVESVSIAPAKITLAKDASEQLTATVSPAGAPQQVWWKSSDEKIVTVDNTGKITAIESGDAVISAISLADGTKESKCLVTVGAAAGTVTIDKKIVELTFGEKIKLTASITPSDAKQDVKWSADNYDLVDIKSDGTVTAKNKSGVARITATSKADKTKKAECIVCIAQQKVTALKLTPPTIQMDTDSVQDFTLTVEPEGATSFVVYKIDEGTTNIKLKKFEKSPSSNTYACTVESGKIEETKNITFFSTANPEIKTVLAVTTSVPKVQSVRIAERDKRLTTEQLEEKLTVEVLPANAEQKVKWSSDQPEIVAVDEESGSLTPKKNGKANITAVSVADETKKDTVTVTVEESLSAISSLTSDKEQVFFGQNAALTAELQPSDAWGDLEWTSSNDDVRVTVDPKNEKKATVSVQKSAKDGSATITVTSKLNRKIKKSVTIPVKTIIPRSFTITCSDSNYKMYKSEVLTFTAAADSIYSSGPEPDASLTWSLKESGESNYTLTAAGKLTCIKPYNVSNGDRITVVATSALDAKVKVEKKITVYDNIAEVSSVTCDQTECTLGTIPFSTLKVDVRVTYTDRNHVYGKVAITEEKNVTGTPLSANLLKAVHDCDGSIYSRIKIVPFKHTSAKAQTFYVYPIDPKTDRAVTTDQTKKFSLTIWEKATGIKIFDNEGDECSKNSKGAYVVRIDRKSSSEGWSVKIAPDYAKPQEFEYKVSGDTNTYGNYYTKLSNYQYENGQNSFTISTEDIGFVYGNKNNQITFTSKRDESITTTLYVTVVK